MIVLDKLNDLALFDYRDSVYFCFLAFIAWKTESGNPVFPDLRRFLAEAVLRPFRLPGVQVPGADGT